MACFVCMSMRGWAVLTPIQDAVYTSVSISFCLFQYFSVPDVWKLDLWNTCIHYPRVHGHAKGNTSDARVMILANWRQLNHLYLPISHFVSSLPWTHITGRGSTTLSYGGHCFSMSSSPSCGEASFGTACLNILYTYYHKIQYIWI